MNRSSTSSSKTLREFPRPTTAFCGVIALLLLVRIVLTIYPDPMYLANRNSAEFLVRQIDDEYRALKSNPKILILGSSRFMLLDKELIGQSLRIDSREIIKLSLVANTYFLMHYFLKRYPESLDDCELVVIDVLPAQLDRYVYLSEESELFFRIASFAEKTKIDSSSMRLLALSDVIFPFYSMRYTAFEWRRNLFYSAIELKRYGREKQSQVRSGILAWLQAVTERERIQLVLDSQYPEAHFSPIQKEALASIFDMVSDETTILLIRPPYRDDVEAIIQNDKKRRESYTQFKSFIESIDRDNVETIWIDSASQLGMNDEDYTGDGAHFSETGLRKIALYLADVIKEKGFIR